MSILNILGIYGESIQKAWEKSEDALTYVLLEDKVDQLQDNLQECVSDYFSWQDPTNSIIGAIFLLTREIIKEEYPELDFYEHINGYDSDIRVLDDGLFEKLLDEDFDIPTDRIKAIMKADLYGKTGLNVDQIVELATHEHVVNDLLKVYENNGDIEIYNSVEELGEDHTDNGCREEDDTNESFGRFLLQTYKDGQSDTLYFELKDGTVISAVLSREE